MLKNHRILSFLTICVFCAPVFSQTVEKITFPVQIDGKILNHPFAGGMDAPQFSNVDLNLDGVLDLFVFDRVGDVVTTFVKDLDLGLSEDFIYAPEYEKIFPPMKEWAIMHDYDQDGIEDLFTSSQTGQAGLVVYKGVVEGGKLKYEPVDTGKGNHKNLYYLNNGNYANIYVAFTDIPALSDVDNDGDMDILNFGTGGSYVFYYRNQSVEKGYGLDSLDFILEETCWGKFQESGFNELLFLSEDCSSCAERNVEESASLRHAGSTLLAFDKDADNDKDLLIGDLSGYSLVMVHNNGDETNACVDEVIPNFPPDDTPVDIPIFISSFYEDINGDGKRDLIAAVNNISGSENVEVAWYYENNGEDNKPIFELKNKRFLGDNMIDVSRRAYPTVVDYNADGLMDIVVGTFGYYLTGGGEDARLLLYENIGTAEMPAFELVDDNYANFSSFNDEYYSFAPTFGDLDNDGDLDLLSGEFFGTLIYAENLAGPGKEFDFATPITGWLDIDVGSLSAPQLFDVNEDGKMDIIVGEKSNNTLNGEVCGNINYFQNIGTPENPEFLSDQKTLPNTECFGGVSSFFDFNIRGDASPFLYKTAEGPKMIVGSHQGYFKAYDNITGNEYGDFDLVDEKLFGIREGNQVHGEFFDFNQNGYLEFIVGNFRGGLSLFKTSIQSDGTMTANNVKQDEVMINIYPNPAKNKLTIGSDHQIVSTDIFNSKGQLIMQVACEANEIKLDVQDVKPGVYFAKVVTKFGTYNRRFMIIN